MNNINELLANWNVTKIKLKQKFATLTDSDVMLVEGKQGEFVDQPQVELGKTKGVIHKPITEL